VASKKKIKFFAKIAFILLIILGLFFTAFIAALKSPKVQTYLAKKVTLSLTESLGVPISIDHVEVEFFNNVNLENLLVKDLNGDSLFYVGQVDASLNYFSVLQKNLNFTTVDLSNVVLHINRAYEDSVFNFKSLHFEKQLTNEVSDTTISTWDVILNHVSVNDVEVHFNDYRSGTIIQNNVEDVALLLNSYRIGDEDINILKFDINNVQSNLVKQAAHPDFQRKKNQLGIIELPFNLTVEDFELAQGAFNLKNDLAKELASKFKHYDMSLTDVDLNVKNLSLFNDSISAKVNNFNFNEKSGLKLKSLQNDLIFTNQQLVLNNINLQTRYSNLEGDVAFTFDDLSAFNDFVNEVKFDIDLKQSTFYASDINLFLNTDVYHVKYPIFFSGNVYGKVNSFKSKKLDVRTTNDTYFNGEFSMNGLPNIEETFISGRINELVVDYDNIKRIYPKSLMPPSIKKLGKLRFNGNFDGFITDFVMLGNLETDLGSANTDLNFKLDVNKIASYSGNFQLNNFEIGKYFGLEDVFGKVSLTGEGEGVGVDLNTLNAKINGLIHHIEIKGYSYDSIAINGQIKDKFFSGHLDIEDDNIALDFDGVVDATGETPIYQFVADVKHFHPKSLNLIEKDLVFKAQVNADVYAKSFNEIIGKTSVKNLVVVSENGEQELGDFDLSSNFLVNGEKRIQIESKDVDAYLEGDFDYAYVLDAFKSVLIPNFKKRIPTQTIKFGVDIKNEPEFLTLFVPDLKIIKPSIIDGNLNSESKSILATVDVPIIQFRNYSVFDFSSNIYVNKGNFDIINSIPEIYFSDSVVISDFSFLIQGQRNDLDLKLFADGIKNSSLELQAKLITKNKRVRLALEPSNIFLNNQYWLIDESNEIRFGETITSKNLRFYNGTSEILMNIDVGLRQQKADLFLSNILIEDFTQFLSAKDITLKGVANGRIGMDITAESPGYYGDLLVENIKVNNYDVGNLNSRAVLDLPNKKVVINGNLYGLDNEVDINGTYSFDAKSTENDLDIDFDIKTFAIYSVEDFIAEYIDNTKGTINGKIKLKGSRKKPNLYGYIDINDVTTTVTYLQTTYNVKNERVTFDKNIIDLGQSIIVSDLEGNVAQGAGKVTHENLRKFALDIDVASDKIIGLNTTYEDNQDFYGKAYINGSVSFKGPVNDILINVRGESEGESKIEIPLLETGTANTYEFYSFKEKNTNEDLNFITKKEKKFRVNGTTVNLDLDIDNDCALRIVLDESSGDVLEVKGEGNIKINVPKEGDVEFYGKYNINDGDYLFTLQNIINKKFRIEPNSSINFQGVIEDAKVDVDAIYELRASPKNLIDDYLIGEDDQTLSEANNRTPVKLLMSLQNNLFEPDILFDIQFYQLTPKIKNYVDRKVLTMKQYENEMNRQVFSLLVLNQFLPPLSSLDQFTNGINIDANDAANTVSEFLSNQVSRYFNDWLSIFSDDVSLNFNYRNYEQDLTSLATVEDLTLRRELQLALTTKFLNDRISINVGGNVDFGENQTGVENNNATYFGGNATIEYALTENRRFRIKAFTNTDYDYFNQGNMTRAGVGLSFKREFDNLKDLKVNKTEYKIKEEKSTSTID